MKSMAEKVFDAYHRDDAAINEYDPDLFLCEKSYDNDPYNPVTKLTFADGSCLIDWGEDFCVGIPNSPNDCFCSHEASGGQHGPYCPCFSGG